MPCDRTATVSVHGRNAAPVCSASYPRTRSRYRVPRKNVEYMPVTRTPRTRLALTRPSRRRTRSGRIGFSIRASTQTNAAISTAASAPMPSTSTDSQPWVETPMIA